MTNSPADQAKDLARLSSDCSFLLTHLIRDRENGDLSCLEKLQSILALNGNSDNPTLKANSVGWYGSESTENAKIYKPYTNNQFVIPTQNKGVCFTESTLAGLKAHREIFKVKYGLAFDREFMFVKGANPCLNIRESLLKAPAINSDEKSLYKSVHNFIPDQLVGFVNIIHESFDSTHEREWRILDDFNFYYQDIKFIFCPQNEFNLFTKIQENALPALFDLMWFIMTPAI